LLLPSTHILQASRSPSFAIGKKYERLKCMPDQRFLLLRLCRILLTTTCPTLLFCDRTCRAGISIWSLTDWLALRREIHVSSDKICLNTYGLTRTLRVSCLSTCIWVSGVT
jgi:hypothetical protein